MTSHTEQNAIGIEGHFRIVKHDVRGLQGSGPDGAVLFEDLWTIDGGGRLRSRYPERLTEDRVVKNKFTRRGLNYFMLMNLRGASGNEQSKQTSELTWPVTGSINPFQALILVGDNAAVTPTRPGDAKVDWNESDAQYNLKISGTTPDPGYGTSGIGCRGCRISDTTTAIFKRVQIRYPNSSPNYEELEYTFFASANAVSQWGGPSNGKDSGIDDLVVKSIGLCNLLTGASSAPWIAPGYNETYSQWGIRAVLGLMPTFQGKSDRDYYHEWFGQGDGTAQGQGTIPASVHVNGSNGSPQYLAAEPIDGDGYVSSYETADVSISALTGVSITIDATNKRVQVTGMSFTASHVRKVLKIRNMTTAGNNKDYKIKRIHASDEVEVFETPAASETDASADADLVTRWTGISAFDGRVENEGLTEKTTPILYDADAAGAIIQGERWASQDSPGGAHYVGRVWASSKTVAGVRIVFPKGSIRDFCPKYFVIQYLASGNPEGGTWTTVTGQSYLASDQSGNIFDNGEYGYEYVFATPVATQGIRVAQITAVDSLRKAEIGELYIFGAMASPVTVVTGASDQLRLAVDGVPTYKNFTCPALAAVSSVQTVCDALNRALYGWGLECVRSTFGYFWLRATCAGNYSQFNLTTIANDAYTALGLPTVATVKTGVTQPLTKLNTDALTLIYTPRMAGNLPKP